MQGHINGVFEAVNDTELGTQSWRLYRSSAYKRLEAAHGAFLRRGRGGRMGVDEVQVAKRVLEFQLKNGQNDSIMCDNLHKTSSVNTSIPSSFVTPSCSPLDPVLMCNKKMFRM